MQVVQKPMWEPGGAQKLQEPGLLSLPKASQSLAQAIGIKDPQLLLLSVKVSI